MILIDMNQVMISNLMVQIKISEGIDKELVRYMVLNSLRMYFQKFCAEYGPEVVLCYDSKRYWRREFFPFYKGNRKKDREKSNFNWSEIFEVLNELRDEIRENMPYKVMDVDGSEADDIISVLTKNISIKNIRLQKDMQPCEKVLVLSGDKDFIQLQKYDFVKQYNPILKKEIKHSNPKQYLLEHIIKGDKSDGIPNFLSDDDTFVVGKRQKPISKKNLENWVKLDSLDFCKTSEEKENYLRNKKLIDLECIPEILATEIVNNYKSLNNSEKKIPLAYFREHQLSKLIEEYGFLNAQPHFEVK